MNQICSSYNSIDPKYCQKPPIYPHTDEICKNFLSDDTCSGKNQCALELLLGDNTHMTIGYICNCSNTKNLIDDVIDHIKNNWKPSPKNSKLVLDVVLGNMMDGFFSNNSRCIIGVLAKIKSKVMSYLTRNNYCVTVGVWGRTPHTEVLWEDGKKGRTPNKSVDVLDSKNWIISR